MARISKYLRWIFFLMVLALMLSSCGSQRKKYLSQVTPIVEQNDMLDARVAELPKVNAFKDSDYLMKLDSYIAAKKAMLTRIEALEPPFMLSATHTKLIQAMNNGIRYLQSEREKFVIAQEQMSKTPTSGRTEDEIIQEYYSQTAAYQADMKEQLMKQQYERLYEEVKDELERARRL